MIEKIKYFIRLDIRKKLKLLNKYTKIQFYPSYFPKNGIKSIYTKIILDKTYYLTDVSVLQPKLIIN